MNRKDFATIGLATTLGFLAGFAATFGRSVSADGPGVVKATRFELVDAAGTVRAFLGVSDQKQLVLSFVQAGRETASFGITSADTPFLKLASKEGDHRASLSLYRDRPVLAMSDNQMEGRLRLGAITHDSPSKNDDDWALTFNDARGARANIGMLKSNDGRRYGFMWIRDDQNRVWPQFQRVPGK